MQVIEDVKLIDKEGLHAWKNQMTGGIQAVWEDFVCVLTERDALRIEYDRLKNNIEELQAKTAAMRNALNTWKRLVHFMKPPKDARNEAPLDSLLKVCIRLTEDALSTTASQDIFDRLQKAEANTAALYQVLHDIYPALAGKVISMHGDEGTRAYQEWSEVANKVFQAEQSTTAGAGLLNQLKWQDAVVSALRRLKAAEKRTGAASLSGLQEIKAASQERQDAEKALNATLAELDGETNG
jgi:regulator of replication initiation timing